MGGLWGYMGSRPWAAGRLRAAGLGYMCGPRRGWLARQPEAAAEDDRGGELGSVSGWGSQALAVQAKVS